MRAGSVKEEAVYCPRAEYEGCIGKRRGSSLPQRGNLNGPRSMKEQFIARERNKRAALVKEEAAHYPKRE
jgi:hypothetical protein